jgi:hypothetical protein
MLTRSTTPNKETSVSISKSKQSEVNSKIKITSRKLKSAKQDAARRHPGADARVAIHQATIARLSSKGKPAAANTRG